MSGYLNDSDLYEGFDEYGNRIVENDSMQMEKWSYGTVQQPPWRLVEGGTVRFQ